MSATDLAMYGAPSDEIALRYKLKRSFDRFASGLEVATEFGLRLRTDLCSPALSKTELITELDLVLFTLNKHLVWAWDAPKRKTPTGYGTGNAEPAR